jgi:hypothetical protein
VEEVEEVEDRQSQGNARASPRLQRQIPVVIVVAQVAKYVTKAALFSALPAHLL